MKKLLYKTLTIQNGIIINSDALDYLSKCVSADDVAAIAAEIKRQATSVVDLEAAKDVLLRILDAQSRTLPERLCEVKNVAYRKRDGVSRLKFLRKHVQKAPQPIYSLCEGKEAVVFGVYRRNHLGEEVVEDDQGVVRTDFSLCESEVFLCECVFLGLRGVLRQSVFYVSEVLLPNILQNAHSGTRERKPKHSFLVFRDFEWNTHMVEKLHAIIGDTANVAFVVFIGQPRASSHVSDALKAHKDVTFVFVPAVCDRSMALLPKKLDYVYTEYNYRSATNPVEIHTEETKVGVLVDEVFEAKAHGRYIGTSHLESLVRMFLSQYAFNPFSGGNMGTSGHMDLMVVVQSTFSCILDVHGTTFVSLGKSSSSSVYLKYSCGAASLVEI